MTFITEIEDFKKSSSREGWKQEIIDWLPRGKSSLLVKNLSKTSEWKLREESIQSSLEEEEFPSGYSVAEDIALQVLELKQFEQFEKSQANLLFYERKPQLDPKLEQRFNELASKWQRETCGLSSITKKITNINYLKIIAMGKAVVPLILRSLEKQPDHWFVALKALTDQDPTSPNDSFAQAVEAWLNWGKNERLID
jgi:hypothetical protein